MIQCFILTCYQNSFTALHPKHFDRPHLDILSYSKQRHLTILKRCQYSLMKRDRGKRLGPTSPFRFLIVINAPDQNTLIQQCVCVMGKKGCQCCSLGFFFFPPPSSLKQTIEGENDRRRRRRRRRWREKSAVRQTVHGGIREHGWFTVP